MHLDLVSCPSARSRRDRESPFEIEMRRDHLTSETAEILLEIVGRDQGFYSRSWVEIRSVRRNYIRTVRISMYVPWYYRVHKRTYIRTCTYPISNFSRTRVPRSRCLLDRDFSDLVSGCTSSYDAQLWTILVTAQLGFSSQAPLRIPQRYCHKLKSRSSGPQTCRNFH